MLTLARKNWTDPDGTLHKNDIYMVSYVGADGKTRQSLGAVADLDAYTQTLEAVVETLKGELQLDTDAGIPYFETIFASNRYIDEWAMSVRNAVRAKPFVVSIDYFEYDFNPTLNKLSYEMDVTTDIGSVTVST